MYFKLHFDVKGNPVDISEQARILAYLFNPVNQVTDMWVFSHGWKNDEGIATTTYDKWTTALEEQLNLHPDHKSKPCFVGIYWPSLATISLFEKGATTSNRPLSANDELELEFWEDEELDSPVAPPENFDETSSFEAGIDEKAAFIDEYRPVFGQMQATYEQDFARLYQLMNEITDLHQAEAEEFVELLSRYQVPDPHTEENEKASMLEALPPEILISSTNELFNLRKTAREVFLAATFWSMKGRAGIVGQTGVASFLREVKLAAKQNSSPLKLHLFGHSFGAKLFSAAVFQLGKYPDFQPPVVDNLTLLLGAFSQYSFTRKVPGGGVGRYNSVVDKKLVRNPILAIYSRYDGANKLSYPLGMFMVDSDKLYELGGADDMLGSIGANGAQGLPVTQARILEMKPLEEEYHFEEYSKISILNIDGHQFINADKDKAFSGAHGDTARPEIYHLALSMSRY